MESKRRKDRLQLPCRTPGLLRDALCPIVRALEHAVKLVAKIIHHFCHTWGSNGKGGTDEVCDALADLAIENGGDHVLGPFSISTGKFISQ